MATAIICTVCAYFQALSRGPIKTIFTNDNALQIPINRLRDRRPKRLSRVARRTLSEMLQYCNRPSTVPRRRIDTRIKVSDRESQSAHFIRTMSAEGPRVTFLGPNNPKFYTRCHRVKKFRNNFFSLSYVLACSHIYLFPKGNNYWSTTGGAIPPREKCKKMAHTLSEIIFFGDDPEGR